MRKYSFFIVGLLLVILLLSGCQSKAEQSVERVKAPQQEVASSHDGLSMQTEKQQYKTTDSKITLLIKNESMEDVFFGAAFSVEKNIDGVWYTVPFKEDIAFIEIAYILPPGKEMTETKSMELLQEKLEPGTYRLLQGFGQLTLAAPFEVVE